ncbi:MAG: hypothetical protein AAF547_12695 [Actinomycetota bacterium]
MSISRDEAREIAILGLLVTAALRALAGVFQVLDELDGPWTVRSLLSRFFTPIGSTIGMLILAAVLIVVLSPSGSITDGVRTLTRRAAAIVLGLGLGASFNSLALSYSTTLAKIWFALINGIAAATLAGTAYWIIRNFDGER